MKYIYYLFLILLFINCSQKSISEKENLSLKDLDPLGEYRAFVYYSDGDLKSVGNIRNLRRHNYWVDFYKDGEQRREIMYHNGEMLLERGGNYPHIQINFDSLKLLVPQKLRVINLFPEDNIYFSENIIYTKLENDPMYDYEITATGGDTAIISYIRLYKDDPKTFPFIKETSIVNYIVEDRIITETIYLARLPIYEAIE